ncbi:hypothetical protein [Mucilaginibacter antarcticus]
MQDKRNLIGSWSGAGDWTKAISVWAGVNENYPSKSTPTPRAAT